MASVGFAVGLGNIWRFPYVIGVYGGSAFLFIYLACALGIGLPLLITELTIGRRGARVRPAVFVPSRRSLAPAPVGATSER